MAPDQKRKRVWDWTIRFTHWSWVVLIIAMWWTADQNHMLWHKWIGLLFIGLLIYRIIWGLIGPATARLLPLVMNLAKIPEYVHRLWRGPKPSTFGHTPLGGLSVVAMLCLMAFQLGTGLMAVDVDGLASGWFGHLVSFEMGRTMSDLHDIGFDALLVMIAIHIIAIVVYYLWLRDNLIASMVTGWRRDKGDIDDSASVDAKAVRIIIALIVSLLIVGVVFWIGQ